MLIRIAALSDVNGWAELRARLWADESVDEHREQAEAILAKSVDQTIAFVALDHAMSTRAFAEAALRYDYVNGCETSPVAFLEAIYVRPEDRHLGLGKRLSLAVEAWARDQGCTELASDALIANVESHDFHRAIGFEETERVVFFRRRL